MIPGLTYRNHLVTILVTDWFRLQYGSKMAVARRNQQRAVFRAIADPTRREILGLLRGGRQTVGVNYRVGDRVPVPSTVGENAPSASGW